MASRYVYGWLVAQDELQALVGSRRSVQEVLEASPADLNEEVFLTLGRGDDDEGEERARGALAEILSGDLEPGNSYRYARVTELLLGLCATEVGGPEIELVLTYYMPGDSWGRWNAALELLGMTTLAGVWGVENMTFPWGPEGEPAHWPTWTVLDPGTLAAVDGELQGLTEARVRTLPADLLVEAGDHHETAAELWTGLQLLRQWVALARRKGRPLYLKMDGSQ